MTTDPQKLLAARQCVRVAFQQLCEADHLVDDDFIFGAMLGAEQALNTLEDELRRRDLVE